MALPMQGLPMALGGTHWRCVVWVPPPQLSVHDDQLYTVTQ